MKNKEWRVFAADTGSGTGNVEEGEAVAEEAVVNESANADEGVTYVDGKYKTVEELEAGYTELHKKFGASAEKNKEELTLQIKDEMRSLVPKEATDYVFTPPEGVVPEGMEFSMDSSNPVFTKWQKLSHDIGLSPEQFDAATALYLENELSILPDPNTEMQKLGENAKARIERVDLWSAKHLTPESYNALQELSGSSSTIILIEEIMKMNNDVGNQGGGSSGESTELTRAEVENMMKDPRYRDPRKREPAYIKRVQDAFKRLYPSK
tara:strand:+ start:3398 stop:4195 length:798 start_codon:yes stop_codon:yes gene_type:complete